MTDTFLIAEKIARLERELVRQVDQLQRDLAALEARHVKRIAELEKRCRELGRAGEHVGGPR